MSLGKTKKVGILCLPGYETASFMRCGWQRANCSSPRHTKRIMEPYVCVFLLSVENDCAIAPVLTFHAIGRPSNSNSCLINSQAENCSMLYIWKIQRVHSSYVCTHWFLALGAYNIDYVGPPIAANWLLLRNYHYYIRSKFDSERRGYNYSSVLIPSALPPLLQRQN